MATSAPAIAVTLQLLSAQVNLTETFNHILRTAPKRECLAFRLKAERGTEESTFVIELGSERHTLTLPNDKKMHLKLADFIEEIANGPLDTSNKGDLAHRPHADRQYGRFEVQDKQRVFELIRTGGVLSLEMGFDAPLHVTVHRPHTLSCITAKALKYVHIRHMASLIDICAYKADEDMQRQHGGQRHAPPAPPTAATTSLQQSQERSS